jgi:hypothetical protein
MVLVSIPRAYTIPLDKSIPGMYRIGMRRKAYSFKFEPEMVRKVDAARKKKKPPVTRTQWMREAVVAKLNAKGKP